MKLIIDISEDMFEWFKNGEIIDEYDKSALKQVFKNGTPLDKVKAEIMSYSDSVDRAISEDEFKRDGMKIAYQDCIEIIDNIGKAESEEK